MRVRGLAAPISPFARCVDFTVCPKRSAASERPAGSDHVDRRRGEFESQAWPPTGVANAVRPGATATDETSGDGMRNRGERRDDLVAGLARTKRPYRWYGDIASTARNPTGTGSRVATRDFQQGAGENFGTDRHRRGNSVMPPFVDALVIAFALCLPACDNQDLTPSTLFVASRQALTNLERR